MFINNSMPLDAYKTQEQLQQKIDPNSTPADPENIEGTETASADGGTETTSEELGLGRDAFMKILVAQMRHQDPLDPMDDREFVAQMAQFSSLEQMQNMNKSLNQFLESNFLYQASSLIGSEVEIRAGSDEEVKGIVTEVQFTEEGPVVVLDGEDEYPMHDIIGMKEPGSESDDG